MTSARLPAPIALFVYSRPDHTRQTLDALARNAGAGQSDLIVFSDGPKNDAARAGVAAVRSLLADVKGFRSVRVVESPVNRGLAAAITAGVTAVTDEYGQAIVMEDDLLTSPHFLDFMNDALNVYRDDEKVGSISGYTFPLDIALPETFFLPDESCWGWATWKRAWAKYEPDGSKLLAEIRRTGRLREFDLYAAYPFRQMLEDQIAGRNNSWAIRWRASLFLHDMLSLYPGGSLTRNIGTDDSGTHATSADTMFDTVLRQAPVTVAPIATTVEPGISVALRRYFLKHTGYGFWPRARRKLKKILAGA